MTSLGEREGPRRNGGGGTTTRVFEEVEDPLASELTRNSHALDRARTVEDFVAMSVQVDDAHAVGRTAAELGAQAELVQRGRRRTRGI